MYRGERRGPRSSPFGAHKPALRLGGLRGSPLAVLAECPLPVTDVADCTILAGTVPQAAGQAYNVAPVEEIRLRHFLGLLCGTLGVCTPRWSVNYHLILTLARAVEGGAR